MVLRNCHSVQSILLIIHFGNVRISYKNRINCCRYCAFLHWRVFPFKYDICLDCVLVECKKSQEMHKTHTKNRFSINIGKHHTFKEQLSPNLKHVKPCVNIYLHTVCFFSSAASSSCRYETSPYTSESKVSVFGICVPTSWRMFEICLFMVEQISVCVRCMFYVVVLMCTRRFISAVNMCLNRP